MTSADGTERWRHWIKTHGPKLYIFARQQTRCEADAEDVFQEAVLRVWTAQGSNGTQGATPSLPQMFATIRRCAIDLSRKNDRRTQREIASSANEQPPITWFESPTESNERAQILEEALRQTPQKYQEVITLKLWGDLTFNQIAETLEIPINTAASRYRYGIESLRKNLNLSVLGWQTLPIQILNRSKTS